MKDNLGQELLVNDIVEFKDINSNLCRGIVKLSFKKWIEIEVNNYFYYFTPEKNIKLIWRG